MDISILIATYKRSELLDQELESFFNMSAGNISFEILVADNADDPQVRKVVESFQDRLPIKYFVETKPGKNSALNRIIPEAKGDIFIFTDDDIVADKNWLKEVYDGVQRWSNCSIFGGKILPYNPQIVPEEFKKIKSYSFSYLYGIADWGDEEGEYDATLIFGANMIVKSKIFKDGNRFNEHLGPLGDCYIPGGETDFLIRMKELNYKTVYLPKVLVFHQIRKEQCEWNWVLKRAFKQGMKNIGLEGTFTLPLILGIPRYLYRSIVEKFLVCIFFLIFRNKEYKEKRFDLEVAMGEIFQYRKLSKNKY